MTKHNLSLANVDIIVNVLYWSFLTFKGWDFPPEFSSSDGKILPQFFIDKPTRKKKP